MSSTIWKSRPSSAANARHGACSDAGRPAAQRPHMTDAEKSAPVFRRVERREVVASLEVELLAADHPECRRRELASDLRAGVGERKPERLGDERVAGEDRSRLAVGGPDARRSAPLGVVVE